MDLAEDVSTLIKYIKILENHIINSGGLLPPLPPALELKIDAIQRDNPLEINEPVDTVTDTETPSIQEDITSEPTQEGLVSPPTNRKKKLQLKRKKDNPVFATYKLSGHKDGIWDLCVPTWTLPRDSATSWIFLSASSDGSVGLWRMEDQNTFYGDLVDSLPTKQKAKTSKQSKNLMDSPTETTSTLLSAQKPRSPRGKSPLYARLSGHIGSVHSVRAHPTLPIVASCGGDGQLLSWKLPSSGQIRPSSQTQTFEPFRIFNIDKKPFKSFSSPWYRHLSSLSSFQERPYHFVSLDYTPKGDRIVMSSISGLGLICDIERPDPIGRFSLDSNFSYISSYSNSSFLTCSQSGRVNIWDLRDLTKPTLDILISKGEVVTCARVVTSSYMATTSHDRTLRIYDLKNHKDPIASVLTTNSRVGSGIPMRFAEQPENPFRILIPFDGKLGKIFNISRAALGSSQDPSDTEMHETPLETLRPKMFTCAAWLPTNDNNSSTALMGSFPAEIYGWKV